MGREVAIRRCDALPLEHFAPLLAESEASGYRFLRRVADEWESDVNRFSLPGEALLAAESCGRLVGVCGLSIDPYLEDPRVGRVRNVYVLSDFRRHGFGCNLVRVAVAMALGHFDVLRLRADEMGPARLYESLGFRPCRGISDCTHVMEMAGRSPERPGTGSRGSG